MGRAWVDERDDAFLDVELSGESGYAEVAPVALDVGDLDGSGRDDLLVTDTTEGVVVVRWSWHDGRGVRAPPPAP